MVGGFSGGGGGAGGGESSFNAEALRKLSDDWRGGGRGGGGGGRGGGGRGLRPRSRRRRPARGGCSTSSPGCRIPRLGPRGCVPDTAAPDSGGGAGWGSVAGGFGVGQVRGFAGRVVWGRVRSCIGGRNRSKPLKIGFGPWRGPRLGSWSIRSRAMIRRRAAVRADDEGSTGPRPEAVGDHDKEEQERATESKLSSTELDGSVDCLGRRLYCWVRWSSGRVGTDEWCSDAVGVSVSRRFIGGHRRSSTIPK